MTDPTDVAPGQTYRHFKKGDLYKVLAVADYTGAHDFKHEWEVKDGADTLGIRGLPEGEKMVTYVGLYDNPHGNRPCVRPLSEWVEDVDYDCNGFIKKIRRYERVT